MPDGAFQLHASERRRWTMPCPKCGSARAHVLHKEEVVSSELCDLETGETMSIGCVGPEKPVMTYRMAECARCGHRFRLSDEEHERVRW